MQRWLRAGPLIREPDVFAPEAVVRAYEGPPQWALRALLNLVQLNLVHPHPPDAPTIEYLSPPSLRIPRAEQRLCCRRLSWRWRRRRIRSLRRCP
ncbi:MAG: hypothetical protein ACRDTT_15600 [Pseudonocardiaceae bacterium]